MTWFFMPGGFGALLLRPDALSDANPPLFPGLGRHSGVLDCTPLRPVVKPSVVTGWEPYLPPHFSLESETAVLINCDLHSLIFFIIHSFVINTWTVNSRFYLRFNYFSKENTKCKHNRQMLQAVKVQPCMSSWDATEDHDHTARNSGLDGSHHRGRPRKSWKGIIEE